MGSLVDVFFTSGEFGVETIKEFLAILLLMVFIDKLLDLFRGVK